MVITQETLIPIGAAIAIAVLLFRAGGKLQKIEDSMRIGEVRFQRIEQSMEHRDETLREMERKIDRIETSLNGAQEKVIAAVKAASHAAGMAAQRAEDRENPK